MGLDKKIISEIERYRQINKYIMEQEAVIPPPPAGDIPPPPGDIPPPPGDVPPPPGGETTPPPAEPQPIDVESDPEVEKIDDEGKSEEKDEDTEELDITDLVSSQKNIENKQEEYFDNLFNQLNNLETKLSEMDNIVNKLNTLEIKIEKYRQKTPEEKLELRTYDSYPFNQKLSDFFVDKQEEMEKTGKNDYILTPDEVTDINSMDIKKSFKPGYFGDEFK